MQTFDAAPDLLAMTRRDAVRTLGALGALGLAGCRSDDGSRRGTESRGPKSGASYRGDPVGEFLVDHTAAYGIPGMAVHVAHDGESRGYALGRNDVDFEVPVTEDTPFQIASVSKIFAGIAIMLLADDGKLDVDAPVEDVLTDSPPAWASIRIHHLLEHTSGLPRDESGAPGFEEEARRRRRREIYVDEAKLDHFTAEERLGYLQTLPLAGAPGDAWSYNQMGFLVAGVIVERLSGSPYAGFLAERVFEPLAMRTAQFGDSRVLVPGRRDSAYTKQYGPLQNWLWPYQTSDYPAAGLNLSAPDLGACVAALAAGRLLSDSARERMWARARLNDGTEVDYGMGWTVDELDGETVVGHEGGGCAWLLHAPRVGATAIALCNLAGSGADETAERILQLVWER